MEYEGKTLMVTIDILINSAGIIFLSKIEDISAKQWELP